MPFEKKILIKNDYVTFGKKKYHIGSKKAFVIKGKIQIGKAYK